MKLREHRWFKRRTPQESVEEDRTKEEVERSLTYLKAQVRVLDARVSTIEHQHGIAGNGA